MQMIRKSIAVTLLSLMVPNLVSALSLSQSNQSMFKQMETARGVTPSQMDAIKNIFQGSPMIGQGNPQISTHPMTFDDLVMKLGQDPKNFYKNAQFEKICGAPYMAPLFDPQAETINEARVCVDMFEYPNVPGVYPVVWVTAREAAELCWAEGKRIGDAHEWEGASHGALTEPDYFFGLSVQQARSAHNAKHERYARYSIGPQWKPGVCAASSFKTSQCDGGSFGLCGSNTYPAGSFPECKSPLGVYDLDGNAAEHMNLPLSPGQMASRGSSELGVTEMKGSWFIWDRVRAHPHWSRWRAPFWHGSRVLDRRSHRNYHLGFRCFKDVG